MTKLEEELDSLFDFSEEQLQEREHHFMKKMWISVGIIVAVLVALSGSTFAMFSTTKPISVGEELFASEINVEAMLDERPSNALSENICEIGSFTVSNDNEEEKVFKLSLIPTGTQGAQGYCKILVSGKDPFYIPVQVNELDSNKTIYIKLEKGTNATIKVEFSWATLNPEIGNILKNGETIPVENTDEVVDSASEGDEAKSDEAKSDATNGENKVTPIENENVENTTPAEEIENKEPIIDNPQIPKEEEVNNET